MDIMKELKAVITPISEDRVALEIMFLNEVSLGVLYYERPKKGWKQKPIIPSRWRCVDANIEGLKVHLAEDDESAKSGVRISFKEMTPKDLMEWAQQQVFDHMSSNG